MNESRVLPPFYRRLWFKGSLLFGVVLLVFLLTERIRGEYALASWKREMATKGERFDYRELTRTNVPFDLEAQREHTKASTNWSSPITGAVIDAPVSMRLLSPGFCSTVLDDDSWTNDSGKRVDWKAYEKAIQPFSNAWTIANRVVLHQSIRTQIDFKDGFETLLPQLPRLKRHVMMANRMGLADLKMGRIEAAIDSMRGVFSIVEQQKDETIAITELVRIAELAIIYRTIWCGVETRRFSSDQLAVLQGELSRINLMRDMANGLRMERAVGLVEFRKLRDGRTTLPTMLDNFGIGETQGATYSEIISNFFTRNVLGVIWKYVWLSHDELAYMQLLQHRIDQCEKTGPAWNPNEETLAKPFNKGLTLGGIPLRFYDRWRYRLTSTSLPGLEKISFKAARMQAQINLAIVACGLHRYQNEHNNYPDLLINLNPRFLSVIPIDPLDGQPLRYKRIGAKQFLLYSVGDDQKDDGGNGNLLVEPKKGQVPQPFNTVDLLWPMRTNRVVF